MGGWLTKCMFPEEQALWHAAHSGDHATLRSALAALTPETRRYLEWQDPCSGRTPLLEAARRGNVACVMALIDNGASCAARDYKGNTVLHLACQDAHVDVVRYLLQVPQVACFETNLAMLAPLDVARESLVKELDNYETHARKPVCEQCIEALEKKFYVNSGWLYEKTETLLSYVSGISNLDSWKRRFCIVFQRGVPDVLELALFDMHPGDRRPACPSTVVLYQIQDGMTEEADSKWFNRKRFAFSVFGSLKHLQGDEKRNAQRIQFAAVDEDGLKMWKVFFAHQQSLLGTRVPPLVTATTATPPMATTEYPRVAMPRPIEVSASIPHSQPPVSQSSMVPPMTVQSRLAASAPTFVSTLEDEDEDLRRAIALSLQETRYEDPALSPPLPMSAPPQWGDETDTLGSECDDHDHVGSSPHTTTTTPKPDEPIESAIGECVVCFDGPQTAVCVPCGHNAVCMLCAEQIMDTTRLCPVCRNPIRELIKLYRV